MKQLFFLIVLALFAITITQKTGIVFAQETVVETDTPIGVDIQATQSAMDKSQRINYELPYPGMLPDNPLYILKVIRDGIVKFLINDSLKKAQFSLLVAEKRMYAGKLLVEKNKDQLAVSTISKSNNYLDESLIAIRMVKKENPKSPDVKLFLQQFKSATLKHLEIARDIKPSIDKNVLDQFIKQEQRIQFYEKTAENLLKQR